MENNNNNLIFGNRKKSPESDRLNQNQKIKNQLRQNEDFDQTKSNYSSFQECQEKIPSFQLGDIVWRNVFLMSSLHILALTGYLIFIIDPSVKWQTSVATLLFGLFSSSLGIIAGAHRLWAHRTYKAKWPLRLLLAIANTMALQDDIFQWARDHRVHHKYSETNADPHDSRRGFFFSHMGWLMLKKHPELKEKGKNIDLSDLLADPIVRFQRKFYVPLVILIWGIIPTLVPYYFWNEKLIYAFLGCVCFRYVYVLHCTWLVNSLAHYSGGKPYDKNIEPRENSFVVYFALGEGYHNYHHTFPWDYSASEYGIRYNFNLPTLFIDICERLGLAYELRKPSKEMVAARKSRTGDGKEIQTVGTRIYAIFDWIIGVGIICLPLILANILRYLVLRTI